MVKLNLPDYESVPTELIGKIESERIRNEITKNWGTQQCRRLLNELTADTRCNTRKGFSESIASVLIELTLIHEMKMQELGYGEFTDSEFVMQPDRWKLPKNF